MLYICWISVICICCVYCVYNECLECVRCEWYMCVVFMLCICLLHLFIVSVLCCIHLLCACCSSVVYTPCVVYSGSTVCLMCAVGVWSVYVWSCRIKQDLMLAGPVLYHRAASLAHLKKKKLGFTVVLNHFHIKKIKGRTISFFYWQVWMR